MNVRFTTRSRMRQIALAAVAASAVLLAPVATVASASTSAGAPAPTPSHSLSQGAVGTLPAVPAAGARTALAPLPPCQGELLRTIDGTLSRYLYTGDKFRQDMIGTLFFGNRVETPKTLALVKRYEEELVFMAVLNDGSLWRINWNLVQVTTTKLTTGGWSGIRSIAGSPAGTRVYALTNNGGLYRYEVTSALTLRGLGPIATTGWGSVKFLSPMQGDLTRDALVGVISTTGGLSKYVIERSTGKANSGRLFNSGWGGIRYISVGNCEESQAAIMIGIHTNNNSYGYFDANSYNFSGADIRTSGQNGWGFSGLISD